MADNPNPQGKGLVPLLTIWDACVPATVIAKSAKRILGEYFTSLLVLSADFAFKPIPQKSYYLYWKKPSAANGVSKINKTSSAWRLSLIEPERLGELDFGHFVGRCSLQVDMTWAIEPDNSLTGNDALLAELRAFQQQFIARHSNQQALESTMPFFVEDLPFYRRLAATALSSSLSRSIKLSALGNIPTEQWLLNRDSLRLPACKQ